MLLFLERTYMNVTGAAKVNDIETLKNAFIRGTCIDQVDKYYKTPLMIACLEGHIEMVKFLIEQK